MYILTLQSRGSEDGLPRPVIRGLTLNLAYITTLSLSQGISRTETKPGMPGRGVPNARRGIELASVPSCPRREEGG